MSYYSSNYYQNPGPVYGPEGDASEPFPGWGPLPNMAGPARVGIGIDPGGTFAPGHLAPTSREQIERAQDAKPSTGFPWPLVGLAALGGAALGIAKNSGWI